MEEGRSSVENRPSDQPPHLLGLGRAWTRVGYVVFGFTILAFVLRLAVVPFLPATPGSLPPPGYRLLAGKGGGMYLNATAIGVATVSLLIFSALATFAWTLTDVVDRRKRFVWLLPMVICPLVFSLQALPLALYLFFARETLGHGEGVQ